MKFLYKIYSGYDGFTPSRIGERATANGKRLRLGWNKYLDVVSIQDEVWVYFHGPQRFENGVYIIGSITAIDFNAKSIEISLRRVSEHQPLTDAATSDNVAGLVAARGRQVFAWPEEIDVLPECSIDMCGRRLCSGCSDWQDIRRLNPKHLRRPEALRSPVQEFIPAYWIIPSRCYVYGEQGQLSDQTRRITHVFSDFKLGEKRYAYPLARGIYESLTEAQLPSFDVIVPVPLSPDKRAAGEVHRTLRLAHELSYLIDVPVREVLELAEPVSKRGCMQAGITRVQFERRYLSCLRVDVKALVAKRVLLIDDVCTRGSTLTQCATALAREINGVHIGSVTAGQMIVKRAVQHQRGFIA